MQKAKKRLVPSLLSTVFVWTLFTLLISISRFVNGYPTESLMEDRILDGRRTKPLKLEDALEKNDGINFHRKEALDNLQKIFGINGHRSNKSIDHDTPPQFMMELYNTVTDQSGLTRRKYPYNAKIVRSFVERDTWLSHLYLFNISGLEINETIIEAELHLFRKRSDLRAIHPTILRSPYYLVRVYQILEGQSMDELDVHRLLNIHYVGAHDSGWQVFNVKQAVLAWITGAPNLGLMVTAATLFGDEASIEFYRRNEYDDSKQPILVLFDDDGRVDEETSDKNNHVPHYYNTFNDDEEDEFVEKETDNDRSNIGEDEENVDPVLRDYYHSNSSVDRRKRQQDECAIEELKKIAAVNENAELNRELDYGTQLGNNLKSGQTEFFKRYKRIGHKQNYGSRLDLWKGRYYFKRENYPDSETREEENNGKIISHSGDFPRYIRSANSDFSQRITIRPDDTLNFVTKKKTRAQQVLSSMDIYERAMLRQIKKKSNKIVTENIKREEENTKQETSNNYNRKEQKRFPREAEKYKGTLNVDSGEPTKCTRHQLYVDFEDIGLSTSIIAPKGYSAFDCQGRCDVFLTHDQRTTNHATVQEIVRRMGLVRDVRMPCCVPTKLLSTSILFFDDNENVVLKMYEDMIVDRCVCR